ncbi:hypothetical protein [Deinococcus hopiensis]|uniref:Uncharacterized protein n=1 Tax=Deinococcus hopiensis KR-140 TaxID=695939 RepID=A0A1W1UWB1_9DEIO|nr:hypothetical protein [Deinococcus hopiensis]SMB85438.1 hypothetical protein SAMN00790413_03403 [Deinococcus hopiensis KR-140]
MTRKLPGELRAKDYMIAIMPDGPIRLKDWLLLLPEGVHRGTASKEPVYLLAERLITRAPGLLGCYAISEAGKARRAEVRAFLKNQSQVHVTGQDAVHTYY